MNVLLLEDNSGDVLLIEKALANLDDVQGNVTVVERLEQALDRPEDLDFQNTKSLGLQLVNGLTRQLGGTIEINKNEGTEFKIVFEG